MPGAYGRQVLVARAALRRILSPVNAHRMVKAVKAGVVKPGVVKPG